MRDKCGARWQIKKWGSEMKAMKTTVEEVLEFLRNAGANEWYLVAEYVRRQTRLRDVQYASQLRVGDKVSFQWPGTEGGPPQHGCITRINRRKGWLSLLADFGDGRPTPSGLPATMVMKA